MTRINVVPPSELTRQHLIAEYREITRVFGLSRRATSPTIPQSYTLGKGHVTFFYDKLAYILDRYHALVDEMRSRGYNANPVHDDDLTQGIDTAMFGGYEPTDEAIAINRHRIAERLGV